MKILTVSITIAIFCAAAALADEPRRLEVLFLGDDGHHKPIERYRVLKQAVAPRGYNICWVEDLREVTRERLDRYDALVSLVQDRIYARLGPMERSLSGSWGGWRSLAPSLKGVTTKRIPRPPPPPVAQN